MALAKSFETGTGAVGDYWRVIRVVVISKVNVEINVALFLNKDARMADKERLDIKDFVYDEQSTLGVDPVLYAYEKLKADDFFSGAQDV